MTGHVTPLIAGNWKMNGLTNALEELQKLTEMLARRAARDVAVAVCPPATLLAAAARIAGPAGILLGGQDCHFAVKGAHTGDISAKMLADAGARLVIVGHSERRAEHGETSELVRRKAEAGIAAGLTPIICVGETEAQRRAGRAVDVVAAQLAASAPDCGADFVVAYEPVWAIGTGLTPTSADIAEMHLSLRQQLAGRFGVRGTGIRLLYGGSVKPANAKEILAIANVNGGLIGGASLLAEDFFAIISAQ